MARQDPEYKTDDERALRGRFPRNEYPGFSMAYERGHLVYYLSRNEGPRYADNDEPVDHDSPRACKACGLVQKGRIPPCMGVLPGVKYAYCGNGRDTGYIMFENGFIIKGFKSPPEGHHKSYKAKKPAQIQMKL